MKIKETTKLEIVSKLMELGLTKIKIYEATIQAFERAETDEAVYIWNDYVKDDSNDPLYKFIFKCQILYGKYHWFIITHDKV